MVKFPNDACRYTNGKVSQKVKLFTYMELHVNIRSRQDKVKLFAYMELHVNIRSRQDNGKVSQQVKLITW